LINCWTFGILQFDQVKSIKQAAEGGKHFFKDESSLDDQMHCVIFIVDSTSINAMTKNDISNNTHKLPKKIEKLQAKLRKQGKFFFYKTKLFYKDIAYVTICNNCCFQY
jgi:hypothetical protein